MPIPEQALDRRGRSKYPWQDLEIEDSFVVPNTKKKTVAASVSAANKRFKGERRFIHYTRQTAVSAFGECLNR